MRTTTIDTASKMDNNGDKIINKLTHRITTTPIIEDDNTGTKTGEKIGQCLKAKPNKPITIRNEDMRYHSICDEFEEPDSIVAVSASLEY